MPQVQLPWFPVGTTEINANLETVCAPLPRFGFERIHTPRLHRLAFPCHDQALQHLGEELTATETTYPGTDLRLVYQLIGATPIPGSQVV